MKKIQNSFSHQIYPLGMIFYNLFTLKVFFFSFFVCFLVKCFQNSTIITIQLEEDCMTSNEFPELTADGLVPGISAACLSTPDTLSVRLCAGRLFHLESVTAASTQGGGSQCCPAHKRHNSNLTVSASD